MKNILLILCLNLILFSCNSKQKQKDVLTDAKEKVTQLTGREDLCSLLDEQTIRTVFQVPDSIDFKKKDNPRICSYSWTEEMDKPAYYRVSLNFANKEPKSPEALTSIWNSQNESLYNKEEREMESVNGVGNAASWSTLGGGQLRVNAEGYIFYISLKAQKFESLGGSLISSIQKKESIELATDLAQRIIKKLQ